METKVDKLINLTLQMGCFFSMCDGNIDKRETDFVDSFIGRVCENYHISPQKVKELRTLVDEDIDIDQIIKDTHELLCMVENKEKKPLLRMLSYFISQIIQADSVIQPIEEQLYNKWKTELEVDNDITITDLLDLDS